ncbi:MAG: hypothetical protein CSA97_01895 [Bacteroidetes bacterium]|nr:MAG: hypothetical protein CSA97_01895 [Bacteroidota bacterium]
MMESSSSGAGKSPSRSGRGRPRDKHEQMRQRILEMASGVFQRFGFSKTTMEDIAQGIGRQKSTLYYYFQSKEDVFAAVVARELEGEMAMIDGLERLDLPPRTLLHKHAAQRLHAAQREYGMVLKSGLDDDRMRQEVSSALTAYSLREREFMGRVFRRVNLDEPLMDIELSALITLAQSALRELEKRAAEAGGDYRLEEVARRWVNFLWYGVSGYRNAPPIED